LIASILLTASDTALASDEEPNILSEMGAGGMVEKFGGQEIEARRRANFAKLHKFSPCIFNMLL
jgi:hypothetical protein